MNWLNEGLKHFNVVFVEVELTGLGPENQKFILGTQTRRAQSELEIVQLGLNFSGQSDHVRRVRVFSARDHVTEIKRVGWLLLRGRVEIDKLEQRLFALVPIDVRVVVVRDFGLCPNIVSAGYSIQTKFHWTVENCLNLFQWDSWPSLTVRGSSAGKGRQWP